MKRDEKYITRIMSVIIFFMVFKTDFFVCIRIYVNWDINDYEWIQLIRCGILFLSISI